MDEYPGDATPMPTWGMLVIAAALAAVFVIAWLTKPQGPPPETFQEHCANLLHQAEVDATYPSEASSSEALLHLWQAEGCYR